ncbi:CPBP family intramembrane metalloprotease [Roseovarius sp. A46]|uniref:CPBP family intramembrane glutamic endopeptidase n=1 Tax=Roseovarius sp. A46 TaxID=2109331 RepID=UPI0010127564|nr:CPBP family intramembrane glutamic endopeptidase [Roseovarius sp. A46]RXV60823.1 CPBP family intramembrane metalloprotease [Roseovarius sp. A46]
MRYAAHEILVAPARPSAGLGRLAAGICLTVALFFLLSIMWSGLLPVIFGVERWARIVPGVETATTPTGVLINLATFGLLIVALALSLRAVHRRGLMSLVGPLPRATRQFGRALLAVAALHAIIALVPLPEAMALERNLAAATWAMLLPLGIAGLFCQVFAEEVAFRGYLQTQLAARFTSPVIWMSLPALGFGLLHFDSVTYGANGWLVMVWATGFGLAAADLTARFGTLGPATALHFVNNFSAILVAAPKGQFDGLALYVFPFSLGEEGAVLAVLPTDILMLLCSWLAIRLALRG